MTNTFFTGKREQFFRPLTHGDRECCAAVLRSLYDRVQGPNADYSEALARDLVLSDPDRSDPQGGRVRARAYRLRRGERADAGELLRKPKEHGWIEDYKDPIDLKPSLKMTRAGKEVSEVLSNLDNSRARTRQRNMRPAKKALAAFAASQDVDELPDGYEPQVIQNLRACGTHTFHLHREREPVCRMGRDGDFEGVVTRVQVAPHDLQSGRPFVGLQQVGVLWRDDHAAHFLLYAGDAAAVT